MKIFPLLLCLLLLSNSASASFLVSKAYINIGSDFVAINSMTEHQHCDMHTAPFKVEQFKLFLSCISNQDKGNAQKLDDTKLSDLSANLVGVSAGGICAAAFVSLLGGGEVAVAACFVAVVLMALIGMVIGIVALARKQRHKARAICAIIFGGLIGLPFLIVLASAFFI